MAHATETKQDARLDRIALDAQEELAALRRETARYREIFDSARLVVGHEFAKPLTSLSGYLELIEERFGAEAGGKERGYFAKMREAIDTFDGLIESFVQMLRAEQGAGEFQTLERIDIAGLIARVRERFGESASLVTTRVEQPLPPVLVRSRGLEVVLENLVSNAIKHGRGPILITASLGRERRGESNEALLIMTVEDRGAGIPEDKIEAAFTPFIRLAGGGGTAGLGLGLAVVKSVVALMNGDIRLTSAPGGGTRVTVSIPVPSDGGIPSDTIG